MTATSTEKTQNPKLIHVAIIFDEKGSNRFLFLRKLGDAYFSWFKEEDGKENETEVNAQTIEEALRLAPRHWKNRSYRTLNCGFRYTLPERDEHGINALFHQMVASYNSMNGVYYDEELGNNCFVQSASNEALNLWQRLKIEKRV